MNFIADYNIISSIFTLSQNPEVRFVSSEFFEISTLNSFRADFLLYKFGKNNVLEIGDNEFTHFPNLLEKQELVLKLLEKGAAPKPNSKQDIFILSIMRGWEKVIEYLLNLFTETTEQEFEFATQKRSSIHNTETPIDVKKLFRYYLPAIDINFNNGEGLKLAIYYKLGCIIKQLLNSHLILPDLTCIQQNMQVLSHPKLNMWGLNLEDLCDVFEEEGINLLKLFFRNGLNNGSVDGSMVCEFSKRGNLKFVKFLAENGFEIEGSCNPFRISILFKHYPISLYLIKRGVNRKIDLGYAIYEP
ncbi:hypothetical protein BB559_004168, partial [Furculomyces boomerangus]